MPYKLHMLQSVTSIQPFGQGMTIRAGNPACNLVLRDFRKRCGMSWEIAKLFLGASPSLPCLPMSPEWKGSSCLLPGCCGCHALEILDQARSCCVRRVSTLWVSGGVQGSQPSHAFARGCSIFILPSPEEIPLVCALRNNETKCGIWVLLSARELEKRSRKQRRKILYWLQKTELSRTQPNRKYQVSIIIQLLIWGMHYHVKI